MRQETFFPQKLDNYGEITGIGYYTFYKRIVFPYTVELKYFS